MDNEFHLVLVSNKTNYSLKIILNYNMYDYLKKGLCEKWLT